MPEQESKRAFREDYYEERRERERRKAKKQKQTESSKVPPLQTPPVQPELQKSTEDRTQIQEISKEIEKNIMVPVLNLREPAISFKTASLALDYPREKKEHQLIVPEFRVFPPAFEFLGFKLDTSFPIRKKTRTLVIPNVKLLKSIIEFSEGRLDIDYSISKQGRKVFIPKFVFQKPSMSFEMASLNVEVLTPRLIHHSAQPTVQARRESVAEINKELMESIQPQEEITKASYAVEAQTGSGEEEVSWEELQDPLEFLFGNGARKVRDVEPLVVLFKDYEDDSYIQTFETLILRIYREKHGGYPEVKKLTLREDWNKREIEQWLDEGKLFLIELDAKDVKIKIDKESLVDRLWAIFSKKKGIVIFYTKNDKIFEEYATLLNEINWSRLHLGAKIVKLIPRRLSFEEKLKLAGLLFGFVDLKGETPPNVSMDAVLNASKDKYEEKLKEIGDEYYNILGIVKPGENESIEHLRGKAFIVRWLIKQLEKKGMMPKGKRKNWKLIKDLIKTEEPKNGAIVDVCFNNENYEFETLFEEGFGKIHKTLRKYEQSQGNVKVVVEPITAFLHAKEFAKLIKIVKQVYPTLDIRFYTLDIKDEKLIPLGDYLKELKSSALGTSFRRGFYNGTH